MSRRNIAEKVQEVNLEQMITVFYENKTQAESYKKVADSFNKDIKKFMQDNEILEFKGEDLQATISIAPKEDFNELRAIEILRESLKPELFEQVVKTKEYLDNDALEQLTYTEKIDLGLLAPCVTQKDPVVTLRVKKVKK